MKTYCYYCNLYGPDPAARPGPLHIRPGPAWPVTYFLYPGPARPAGHPARADLWLPVNNKLVSFTRVYDTSSCFSWTSLAYMCNFCTMGNMCNMCNMCKLQHVQLLHHVQHVPPVQIATRPPERGGQGGQNPRGPATFRGPAGPTVNIVNVIYGAMGPQLLYMRGPVTPLPRGPELSLGGPDCNMCNKFNMCKCNTCNMCTMCSLTLITVLPGCSIYKVVRFTRLFGKINYICAMYKDKLLVKVKITFVSCWKVYFQNYTK